MFSFWTEHQLPGVLSAAVNLTRLINLAELTHKVYFPLIESANKKEKWQNTSATKAKVEEQKPACWNHKVYCLV